MNIQAYSETTISLHIFITRILFYNNEATIILNLFFFFAILFFTNKTHFQFQLNNALEKKSEEELQNYKRLVCGKHFLLVPGSVFKTRRETLKGRLTE